MKVTIIPDGNTCGVDGVFRRIDMTGIAPTIRAVYVDTESGKAKVEFNADDAGFPVENLFALTNIATQALIDRWTAAAPIPQEPIPPLDQSDITNIQKHIKAAVLAAAIMSGKTVVQAKAAYKTAWDSLP